jgi:hypothetical protein
MIDWMTNRPANCCIKCNKPGPENDIYATRLISGPALTTLLLRDG